MSSILDKTLYEIDVINAQDPNKETVNCDVKPKELVYGQRMTACLNKYWPNANNLLRIAVRAQHIKRWHIKRTDYPEGKAGYLKWRKSLGEFHADLASQVMRECGYEENERDTVASIIRKEKLRSNKDSQTLEDVACLVFLQYYFEAFSAKHDEEKVISIVQKTWNKMSDAGKEIALTLTLPTHLNELVKKALA
jgi:Domain of unknown function (DUF4202)